MLCLRSYPPLLGNVDAEEGGAFFKPRFFSQLLKVGRLLRNHGMPLSCGFLARLVHFPDNALTPPDQSTRYMKCRLVLVELTLSTLYISIFETNNRWWSSCAGQSISQKPETPKFSSLSPLLSYALSFCRAYFFVVEHQRRNHPLDASEHGIEKELVSALL